MMEVLLSDLLHFDSLFSCSVINKNSLTKCMSFKAHYQTLNNPEITITTVFKDTNLSVAEEMLTLIHEVKTTQGPVLTRQKC